MKSQKGVALLLVLWVLALLSLLLGGLNVMVQGEFRQSEWQRNKTQALLAAEAGVNLAVVALKNPQQGDASQADDNWQADGTPHRLMFDGIALTLTVRSERGLLDLNAADTEALTRLAQACGESRSAALNLADAIEQRRSGDSRPLLVVEELRALPGVTSQHFDCLAANTTVWSGLPQPDPAFAPALLRQALNLPAIAAMGSQAGQILQLTSTATLASGFTQRLKVTLLLDNSLQKGRPYRVLHWQE